jgi:glycosyltransferase involved in cell wall biosynthesis
MPVTASLRVCAVIPTFDNPRTIAAVARRVREHIADVVVVDDGSGPEGRAAVEALAASGEVVAVHRARNGGKGAAVLDGLHKASELGFTHALQIDADGQHDPSDIPRMLDAATHEPDALVLAAPVFDDTAPKSRLVGRKITVFWTDLEVGRGVITDPMCGLRVYPVARALAVPVVGRRMEFDIEIAVRMAWAGAPVVNLPVKVAYLPAAQGGVSHFRMFEDNVRISWMHTRLMHRKVLGGLWRWLTGRGRTRAADGRS